jgi:hypothetical protein
MMVVASTNWRCGGDETFHVRTVLHVGALLNFHVFIAMLLVPPIALKIGSTGYRFIRYYAGTPAYRRKGPPLALLRVFGPFVVVLTIVFFASGIGLLFAAAGLRRELLFIHRTSFFVWFAAMTVHGLGHIRDTPRLALGDFYWRTRTQVAGAGARQWAIAASLVVGALLGAVCLGQVGHYLAR